MSKTYDFRGRKGSGVSSLAVMLHQMGHKVQRWDVEKYSGTQGGREKGGGGGKEGKGKRGDGEEEGGKEERKKKEIT